MSDSDDHDDTPPPYLTEWRGLSIRRGNEIVPAPPEDVAVARRYPTAAEKGEIVEGARLTILTAKRCYRIGEEVRVIHVMEIVEPGYELLVMGPKPVYGEYIDGQLVTPLPPEAEEYDGAVIESPNVDYNYDITAYRFLEPGRHEIHWEMGALRSNTIELEIVE